MKKYFCDVCGAELCELEDLCARCDGLVRALDVSGLVMAELRRLIETKPEEPTPPAPAPALKGKGAREKRAILAAVEAFRKEYGPGSLTTLAKLARVGEGELRDLISCEKVPLTIWRAVGRALGVGCAAEEAEAAS